MKSTSSIDTPPTLLGPGGAPSSSSCSRSSFDDDDYLDEWAVTNIGWINGGPPDEKNDSMSVADGTAVTAAVEEQQVASAGTRNDECSPAWKRLLFSAIFVLVIVGVVLQRPMTSSHSDGMDKQLQQGVNDNGDNHGSEDEESQDATSSPDDGSSGGNQTVSTPTLEPGMVTVNPTFHPTIGETALPTQNPTAGPSPYPSLAPTPIVATFNPGELTVRQNGLRLSTGLTSRLLAATGTRVSYDGGAGSSSTDRFHALPDAGACFVDRNRANPGGWIYVSNAEVRDLGQGGVGAMTFNAAGQVIDYQRVLRDTTANCGGGRTPWGAWVSCEEYSQGLCWQVDPSGVRPPQVITLGNDGGNFESFAYDVRDEENPAFFITEDSQDGALQRFRPNSPDWSDPWNILLGQGRTDYLVLEHNDDWWSGGTFEWTTIRDRAMESASWNYPNAEGIDVYDGRLYFISKQYSAMYILDLDTFEFTVESTETGLFTGGPDQIKRILNDDTSNLLFFTEDGGNRAGVHARNENGEYFTILDSSEYENETTGLSFSPDGKAMYIAYQVDGLLFEIRREDGLPFYGRSLNVAYHATATVE